MAKDIYDNIDDVKSSLDNAQRSFRKNNGLRGELDLMLAEASIRYLREKRGPASVWNRQKLAAVLAVLLVLAGYGGWWYAGLMQSRQEKAPAVNAAAVQQSAPAPAEQQTMVKARQEEAPKMQPSAELNIQNNNSSKNYLAEKDLQQLVRTGRQVLQDAD